MPLSDGDAPGWSRVRFRSQADELARRSVSYWGFERRAPVVVPGVARTRCSAESRDEMTQPLVARLAEGPLLADGACGTMLYAAGVPLEHSFDELNLSRPELVAGVHRAYINA